MYVTYALYQSKPWAVQILAKVILRQGVPGMPPLQCAPASTVVVHHEGHMDLGYKICTSGVTSLYHYGRDWNEALVFLCIETSAFTRRYGKPYGKNHTEATIQKLVPPLSIPIVARRYLVLFEPQSAIFCCVEVWQITYRLSMMLKSR